MEKHHIIKRGQAPTLIKCPINIIELTPEQHRGTYGVHGKYGHELDQRLKLEFQNQLEIRFDKKLLSKSEINSVLQISEKALNKLLKTLKPIKGLLVREDVIRACMGGKMIIQEDIKE